MNETPNIIYREWPHSPSHLFVPNAAYMVTAGVYGKALLFDTAEKLDSLQHSLFEEAERFQWQLQAWAVMANHYHFIAHAPADAATLKDFIRSLHSKTARWLNRHDRTPGRQVWFQYWDACLTYEKSYLARLNYVHNNPVKHGLVGNAKNYPWCSMNWFTRQADNDFRRTVASFKTDRVNVKDDFALEDGGLPSLSGLHDETRNQDSAMQSEGKPSHSKGKP
ncbi:MAG: transposase [FCB group bacterium]|jgi:putative transposase|nr:transposase [FCB group bacterium]